MKQCERCYELNPAEIHTCTPWMRNKDWSYKDEIHYIENDEVITDSNSYSQDEIYDDKFAKEIKREHELQLEEDLREYKRNLF